MKTHVLKSVLTVRLLYYESYASVIHTKAYTRLKAV